MPVSQQDRVETYLRYFTDTQLAEDIHNGMPQGKTAFIQDFGSTIHWHMNWCPSNLFTYQCLGPGHRGWKDRKRKRWIYIIIKCIPQITGCFLQCITNTFMPSHSCCDLFTLNHFENPFLGPLPFLWQHLFSIPSHTPGIETEAAWGMPHIRFWCIREPSRVRKVMMVPSMGSELLNISFFIPSLKSCLRSLSTPLVEMVLCCLGGRRDGDCV